MHTPPRLPLRFFRWFCHPDFREDIEGDLLERFEKRVKESGTKKAKWHFVKDILLLFRPGIIRSLERIQKLNNYGMIRHNFIITLRNFYRHKSSFIINMTGLSTGLACTLLIYLWVNDELSFDRFHENGDRTYVIMQNQPLANGVETYTGTSGLLASALEEEVPEIDQAFRTSDWIETFNVFRGKKRLKAQCMMADPEFFKIFSYKLLQGDSRQVLQEKNAMVISSTLAINLFKTTEDIVGQRLNWESQGLSGDVIVTGVFDDTSLNSSDKFDFILPYKVYEDLVEYKQWGNNYARTFVTLKSGAEKTNVDIKIRDFLVKKDESMTSSLFLKSYEDRYLYNAYENGKQVGGRIIYVRSFAIIGLFILLIASINFMNLSTAKSSLRIKEVGVKKVLGARRKNLIYQYLTESVLLSFFSLIIALALVFLLLPQFNQLTGKQLSLHFDREIGYMMMLLCTITGILAGSYPAFYLSNFKPVSILKGKLPRSVGELWIRKGLVIFQFALSVILVAGVLVVYKQIEFIQTKNLGYDQANIIRFEQELKILENQDVFLSELRKLPGVVNAGGTNLTVGFGNYTYGVGWEGKNPDLSLEFREVKIGYEVIETLGLEMAEGRPFLKIFGDESSKIIFNETAIEKMGIKDPIGKTINHYKGDKQIVGVVKDFHFESFHEKQKPMFFRFYPHETWQVFTRLKNGKEQEALEAIDELFSEFSPGSTFDYQFLDNDYQALYTSEHRIGILSRYFAGIAILISCLGLFGLVAFNAERRSKEIGIRKVLGSSVLRVVYLLSTDFTKMVLSGIIIALPISYFLIKSWLDNFAYRVEIELWYFLLAGLVALIIAWLTVGYQTLKAANINPAQCLRNE